MLQAILAACWNLANPLMAGIYRCNPSDINSLIRVESVELFQPSEALDCDC